MVITDLMMPDIDGLELVRLLRERPELRDTAVIMLSARADLEDRIRGRQLGVDTYLAKPFHPQEVNAAVEGLLRSRMRLVGRYLVHERLGTGGQSQVFRAESLDTGAEVALKIISGAGLDDKKARDRLSKEHRALKELVHPNIVRVIDNGFEQAGHFLSMELLEGVTLAELVRSRGRLSAHEVKTVGLVLASALRAVHEAGLVHRDIKPSNVLVVSGPGELGTRIRLIDFGTASHVSTIVQDDA